MGWGSKVSKMRFTNRHSSGITLVSGEVLDIITNSKHPEYGSEGDLGKILFNSMAHGSAVTGGGNSGATWIRPLQRYVHTWPLVGEIVLAVAAANAHAAVQPSSTTLYYLETISIYGEKNENTMPNASFAADSNEATAEENSFVNDVKGETFEERVLEQIQCFEGDTLIQGRFDNSIRLGSTVNGDALENSWSQGSENGDPIMILTNGFDTDSDKVGEVNDDNSTIMLTSTQTIDFKVANKEAPQTVAVPTGPVIPMMPTNMHKNKPQVIINSDRLIFNAREDNVIISAKKDISLSTSKWKVNVTALADILLETLNQLTMEIHPTPAGPSGPPINAPIYMMLKTQLEQMKQ